MSCGVKTPQVLSVVAEAGRDSSVPCEQCGAAVRCCVSDGVKTDETCRFENH
jgi:hypothetical protein